MSSYARKLGALVATGALIATVAIPAYAVVGSAAAATSHTPSAQTVPLASRVTLGAPSRDGYSVTVPVPLPVPGPVVAAVGHIPVSNKYSGITVNPPALSYSGAAVLQYASQFVGVVPYGTGNSPETSFSCDGFTQYVFAGFGISLPRGADHQARLGVRISQADAVGGDLVYWPGQHIGIYDGAGGMYNSPRPGRYVEHVGSLWGSPLFIRLTV